MSNNNDNKIISNFTGNKSKLRAWIWPKTWQVVLCKHSIVHKSHSNMCVPQTVRYKWHIWKQTTNGWCLRHHHQWLKLPCTQPCVVSTQHLLHYLNCPGVSLATTGK